MQSEARQIKYRKVKQGPKMLNLEASKLGVRGPGPLDPLLSMHKSTCRSIHRGACRSMHRGKNQDFM